MSLDKPGAFTLPYSQKYKRSSVYDFPKFALTKKDEKGVIMVVDPEPTCAFLHWIITGTRVDHTTKTTVFSGAYYLCLGRPETLMTEENDPEVCAFCKAAEDIDDAPVGLARFKACTHIIHYGTTPMGQLSTAAGQPPMFQLKVWVFGQQVYNLLADKKDMWGEHTYRHHDLIVTCVSPKYRNYQIELMPKAVWLEAEYTKLGEDGKPISGLALTIAALYKQARLKDLGPVLGKSVTTEEGAKLVAKAKSVVSEMSTGQGQTPRQVEAAVNVGPGQSVPSNVDIDDLFSDSTLSPPAGTPAESSPTQSKTPLPQADAPLPQVEQASMEETKKIVETPDGELDFDALLAG